MWNLSRKLEEIKTKGEKNHQTRLKMSKPFLRRPKTRSKIKRICVDCVRVMGEGVLDFLSVPLEDCLIYSVQFWDQKDALRLKTIQRWITKKRNRKKIPEWQQGLIFEESLNRFVSGDRSRWPRPSAVLHGYVKICKWQQAGEVFVSMHCHCLFLCSKALFSKHTSLFRAWALALQPK